MTRDVFNAIADPTRRGILISLTNQSKNVNALADKFDMSRQAVSLHIQYLKDCGLISIKKQGRERYCSLKVQKLSDVEEWLQPFRKMWTGKFRQLDSLLEDLQTEPKKKS